ncbi:MAG TPA: winged helix-turn-helix transcriptional regulator [Solirubrobacterales bacterium]|nr:winged helix-turn-helix transcriptional regulator [Solirubrobacterales bacterium]
MLLAAPTNAAVLQALGDSPRSLVELRRATGTLSQSTLRARLRELVALGVLKPKRRDGFPRALDYELDGRGRELLVVGEVLQGWLADCPQGPVAYGSDLAKVMVRALVEGWSSTVIRALAAKPLALTELDGLISNLNYPSLERRLGTMRRAGQIEPLPSSRPGTPYAVTDWLRRGVAPLAAAARWERLNAAGETTPIGRLDIEAALLLTVPMLHLPGELSGSCRLVVEISSRGERRLAGVRVGVAKGCIETCVTSLGGSAGAWATGPASAWLSAVLEHDRSRLELGGDCQLAGDLVDGLHRVLFGPALPANP